MNLSILISNRTKILLVFIIFIVLNIIYTIALQQYIYYKTTSTFWYEDKISKSYHFEKNQLYNLDYAFIGTSRTLYHISTKIFNKKFMRIYNFGIPFFTLYEHPLYVDKAISFRPKSIVISLSINEMFEEPFIGDDLTLKDIQFIFKTQSYQTKYESIMHYIRNITELLRLRNSVYLKKEIISYFNRSYIYRDKDKTKEYTHISSDCSIFDKKKVSDNRSIVMCSNGDSIIYAQNNFLKSSQKQYAQKELVNFNIDYINFLNSLIDNIKQHNIKPIIILEPIYQNHYIYTLDKIKKTLHTKNVIDLTNYKIKKSFWADLRHLNNKGRIKYSEYLSSMISTLILIKN